MTTVYVVRHGETEWNATHRIQGSTDIALSAAGRLQALRLAKRFSDVPLDRIYSSPLQRARMTAEHIAGPKSITIEDALAERSLGEWEGLHYPEVDERHPEQRKAWLSDPHFAPAGGESLVQVWDRAQRVWQEALKDPASTILFVTHAYVANMLLGITTGIPRESPWSAYAFRVPNAGVSVIDVTDLIPKLVLLNDLTHLEEQ
jgi:broad specificity phosphatase PhoE